MSEIFLLDGKRMSSGFRSLLERNPCFRRFFSAFPRCQTYLDITER